MNALNSEQNKRNRIIILSSLDSIIQNKQKTRKKHPNETIHAFYIFTYIIVHFFLVFSYTYFFCDFINLVIYIKIF